MLRPGTPHDMKTLTDADVTDSHPDGVRIAAESVADEALLKKSVQVEVENRSKTDPLRPALLLLVHRLPYPPNKGDKIRSYHLLCHLQQHYRVYLGSFIDDERDWEHVDKVKSLCVQTHIEALQPWRAKFSCAKALLKRQPLTISYYCHKSMQRWVSRLLEEQTIDRAVVFSAAMAQYLTEQPTINIPARRVIDFVDVDSDKWRQYAAKRRGIARWFYRREADLLERYECLLADTFFDHSLFVSQAEAGLFNRLLKRFEPKLNRAVPAAGNSQRIDFYNNGVDSDYFCPASEYLRPYPPSQRILVFTGAMNYWPNEDAVCWFAKQVFPGIVAHHPDVYLYVVGGQPSRRVQALDQHTHVVVTGRVDDMRPYLQHADICVAPMRVARGVQNKVLEGMAMARPVVTSAAGLEGINARVGDELLLASEPEDYLNCITDILAGHCNGIGERARQCIHRNYNWSRNLAAFSQWLEAPAVDSLPVISPSELVL